MTQNPSPDSEKHLLNSREIRWAPRVDPDKILRLYRSEARGPGMVDEALLDDVLMMFYVRCESILTASAAAGGRVKCPRCEHLILRKSADSSADLYCEHCEWETTWKLYHNTYKGKKLHIGGAGPAIAAFMEGVPRARAPGDKMLLIDRLIHAFHWEFANRPSRPIAVNVINGNIRSVLHLIEDLAYGDITRPEMLQTRDRFKQTKQRAEEIWGKMS